MESECTAPPLLLPDRYAPSQECFWGSPTTYGTVPLSRALPHPPPRRGAHGAPGSAPPSRGRLRAGSTPRGRSRRKRRGTGRPHPTAAPLRTTTRQHPPRSAPSAAAAVPRPPPSGPAPFRAALAAPGLTWPGRARLLWRRLRRRLGPAAAREGFCRVGRVLPAPEPPPAALTHPAAPSTRAGRGEERGGRGTGRGGRSAPRGAAVPGAALKEPPGAAPRSSAGPRGARGSGILHRPRGLRVGFPGAARVRRVTLAGRAGPLLHTQRTRDGRAAARRPDTSATALRRAARCHRGAAPRAAPARHALPAAVSCGEAPFGATLLNEQLSELTVRSPQYRKSECCASQAVQRRSPRQTTSVPRLTPRGEAKKETNKKKKPKLMLLEVGKIKLSRHRCDTSQKKNKIQLKKEKIHF